MSFITRQGAELRKNGVRFRFNGTNSYHLPTYQKLSPSVVTNEFNAFALAGITVVRTWGFYDGAPQFGGDPTFQPNPGEYNESDLVHLDNIVWRAKQAGIYLIIPFVNYWTQLGGITVYNEWAGEANPASNRMEKFMNGAQQQQWYRDWISYLLNRVNTITGVAYKDEPAILCWQPMNEGRHPTAGNSSTTLRDWYQDIFQYIKSIDSNHLVSTGEEGFDNGSPSIYEESYSNTYWMRANEGTSHFLNSQIPENDMCWWHWYPSEYGFGWPSGPDATATLNNIINGGYAKCADHQRVSEFTNRPHVVGEWGLPFYGANNDQAQEVKGIVYDPFYDAMLNTPDLAGGLLWQFVNGGSPKASEFGGNIAYPGGRNDNLLFASYEQFTQDMATSVSGAVISLVNAAHNAVELSIEQYDAQAIQHDIRRSVTGAGLGEIIASDINPEQNFIDSTVSPDTQYHYTLVSRY